jgi:hypothetical protein
VNHRSAVKLALVLGALLSTTAARAALPAPLEPLSFLLGDWEAGDNTGAYGKGAGRCAFSSGLGDRVILRTNHAEYPASATSPAVVHDDLMVIYFAQDGKVQAHFYDNEGHFIHYVVTFPGPQQALFTGDATANAPRFRLTYKLRPDGAVDGEFAGAPPGQPEVFKPYLAWQMRKAGSGGK